jgi:hypothetical protein
MQGEVEAVGEKALQHEIELLLCRIRRYLRSDIVSLRRQPIRAACLVGFQSVSAQENTRQGDVGEDNPVRVRVPGPPRMFDL